MVEACQHRRYVQQAVAFAPVIAQTTTTIDAGEAIGQAIGALWLLWAIIAIAYWLPTLIAAIRRNGEVLRVLVINGLIGWTAIGWFVALAIALRRAPRPAGASFNYAQPPRRDLPRRNPSDWVD